jgi:hypothetical protein
MTKIKLIGAVAILSAAIVSPVLAQDEGVLGPGSRNGMTPRPGATHHLRGHHYYHNGYAHFRGMTRYRSSMASSSRPGGQPISRNPAAN